MNTVYLETGAGWTGSLLPMKRWTRKKNRRDDSFDI